MADMSFLCDKAAASHVAMSTAWSWSLKPQKSSFSLDNKQINIFFYF
jgi:hypothetical protein